MPGGPGVARGVMGPVGPGAIVPADRAALGDPADLALRAAAAAAAYHGILAAKKGLEFPESHHTNERKNFIAVKQITEFVRQNLQVQYH